MNLLEEVIDFIYNIIKYSVSGICILLILVYVNKQVNPVIDIPLTNLVSEQFIIKEDKPTYEYLKSVTVYIVHKEGVKDNGKMKGSIGSGTVIKETEKEFYILTNKHVCGISTDDPEKYILDKDNCFISSTGQPQQAWVKMTYVKSAKDGVDLELWKVNKILLPNNHPIKGINNISIQDSAYNVGNYLSIPFIYSEGTFAGYEFDSYIFNLPSAPGCSGSGIFNSKGELVAVLFAGNMISMFDIDTAKALAISSENVAEFLQGYV